MAAGFLSHPLPILGNPEPRDSFSPGSTKMTLLGLVPPAPPSFPSVSPLLACMAPRPSLSASLLDPCGHMLDFSAIYSSRYEIPPPHQAHTMASSLAGAPSHHRHLLLCQGSAPKHPSACPATTARFTFHSSTVGHPPHVRSFFESFLSAFLLMETLWFGFNPALAHLSLCTCCSFLLEALKSPRPATVWTPLILRSPPV